MPSTQRGRVRVGRDPDHSQGPRSVLPRVIRAWRHQDWVARDRPNQVQGSWLPGREGDTGCRRSCPLIAPGYWQGRPNPVIQQLLRAGELLNHPASELQTFSLIGYCHERGHWIQIRKSLLTCGAPLRNRTVDLLLTMDGQAVPVTAVYPRPRRDRGWR